MQSVTPLLLGAGYLDAYEVHNPLSAWIPRIDESGFRPEATAASPDIAARFNEAMQEMASQALRMLDEARKILKYPGDVVSLLPMGTYVSFTYRCGADPLARALEAMAGNRDAGVAELRGAIAYALAEALRRWGVRPALPEP